MKTKNTFQEILTYIKRLPEQTEYWKSQSMAWGIVLIILVVAIIGTVILTLSSISGGGILSYAATGSPGKVTFRHDTHMSFQNGKYKDCKVCHDKLFGAQKYGSFVINALKDSPPVKFRIGKDTSTLFVQNGTAVDESTLITYEVPRACATCATGQCHDGKESFSRFECLQCHKSHF